VNERNGVYIIEALDIIQGIQGGSGKHEEERKRVNRHCYNISGSEGRQVPGVKWLREKW